MTLHIEPQADMALPDNRTPPNWEMRTAAAAETIRMLAEHGLDVNVTSTDRDTAAQLLLAHAEDPELVKKKATPVRTAKLTPATLLATDKLLKDFGHSVVDSAAQVRHYVTNKLIDESDNPDARIRIRALELLGKISDVGLFADKTEVTVTHQSTDDIKERLRGKLTKLMPVHHDVEDAVVLDGEVLDLDSELGLKDE